MLNFIEKTAASTKEFVNTHKTGITIAVTATATFVATVAAAKWVHSEYNETVDTFLDEHNLTDEFNMLFIDPEDIDA
jgi:hypothetical protein